MTIAAKVPDYQVNNRLWPDDHYEGGDLFRDTAVIEMTPPPAPGGEWSVDWKWMSKPEGREPPS